MTYDDYVDNLKDSADAAEERQEYLESLPAELDALRAELAAERSKAAGLVPYAETVQPYGGEAGKDSARLDHLIDRKLLSCDVFEDAAEMCIKAGCEDPDNDRRWVRAAIDRSEEEGRC